MEVKHNTVEVLQAHRTRNLHRVVHGLWKSAYGRGMPDDATQQPTRARTPGARLTIGELADQVGLTPTAVRMWEQRHDFPRPERLPGGHRRYSDHDVEMVREVVDLRERGVRLEDAVARVRAASAPLVPSVFATLREQHPELDVHHMHKSTLLAMSWAIEDQVAALADRALMWGAFQRTRFYRPSSPRWRDLATVSAGVTVFADFTVSDPWTTPREVALDPSAPMLREWAVVVDSPTFPVALSAWELPGQEHLEDRSRQFETLWTLHPGAVREAARVCATVAREAHPDFERGRFAVPAPLGPLDQSAPSVERVSALFGRMAAYVDRFVPVSEHVTIPPLHRDRAAAAS